MGWDTYFALGGRITEANVLRQASQVKSLGLQSLGFRYIWLDVGWWHGNRAANGEILVSPTQWPHGLSWLTRTLHAAGFLVGLYTDAGPDGCGGAGEGSFGHYQQDADTFAGWGFDAVKVDFCGGSERGLDPATAYTAFHQALVNNSRRTADAALDLRLPAARTARRRPAGAGPVLGFTSFTFGPAVGNSWRTDTDVGLPGNVTFNGVLRNMDADAANPQAAGPGHWNDPDYLAPGQGMSSTQFRSQLSMWAMLAAPLMVSADLTKINSTNLSYLRNREVLGVDQDPAGMQGTLVASAGNGEVWVKPLADGSRAVALLNRGSSAMRISTAATAVGMATGGSDSWRDLWTHRNISSGRLDLRDGAGRRHNPAASRRALTRERSSPGSGSVAAAAVTLPTLLICTFDPVDRHGGAVGDRPMQEMGKFGVLCRVALTLNDQYEGVAVESACAADVLRSGAPRSSRRGSLIPASAVPRPAGSWRGSARRSPSRSQPPGPHRQA